ncbi:site-2 protease family protein [candidate division WOR-3 bacterium]|nr:site-2 protease family protein [candidate division WOR-3 bacterium]
MSEQLPPPARSPADVWPVNPAELSRYMAVTGILGSRLHGRIREPIADNLSSIKALFARAGLVVSLERTPDGHSMTWGYVPVRKHAPVWVNVVLFLATVGTTLLVGALNRGGNPFRNPLDLILGVPFSFSIILVLGSHELAHYLAARRLGVAATLPYFLPVPHPMTGTMGAFIRITSPVPSRSALVRVGFAGPLVGFLVALPVSLIGLLLSQPVVKSATRGIELGSPLVFLMLSKLTHPNLAPELDLMLHPMAFAGWLGLFVTALNLLPVGQLDGGHIAYAVFGRNWSRYSLVVIGLLLVMGFFWLGWPFWAVLVVVFGLRHPPPLDDVTPLSRADRWLAIAALALIILTFTPTPFGAARF